MSKRFAVIEVGCGSPGHRPSWEDMCDKLEERKDEIKQVINVWAEQGGYYAMVELRDPTPWVVKD